MGISLELEKAVGDPAIGVDEAGRGPLAGAVYAAAVSVPVAIAEELLAGEWSAFNDFLKIWLYMDGPQAVLKYVHEKTGMKFNRHTKNHCDICRTIFTDKRIIPLIRDNFFDAAYFPLLLYNTRAEKENEERAKR